MKNHMTSGHVAQCLDQLHHCEPQSLVSYKT